MAKIILPSPRDELRMANNIGPSSFPGFMATNWELFKKKKKKRRHKFGSYWPAGFAAGKNALSPFLYTKAVV